MTLTHAPRRQSLPAERVPLMAERGDRTIVLRDGRRLGYLDQGPRDGRPVLFFHGLGTSRVICPIDEPAAHDLGLRLIAVDRPGIGLSDRLPRRRLLDWPSDVAELADQLGLADIAVIGWSGGGPYAAACAYLLPERVRAAGLVSAPSPLSGPGKADELRRFHRTAARAAGRAPWMIRLALWHWGRPQRRDAELYFDKALAEMGRVDQQVLSAPGLRQQMIDNSAELYRQGGRGMYDEALVLARPWGFDPRSISLPVHIWHGEQDEVVPVAMARHMASILPSCRATFYPDEGHHLLYRRWPEILAALA
ncbi:MAG TPA: alpha/beta hydrolase [Candidatus Limnocylindrales bacterium]|jgi:pimeloyl-ACP methyl ester carboxylesterase|nr:alpha/beta hydrolase [Candidatus Limnocylindrales bacterium]